MVEYLSKSGLKVFNPKSTLLSNKNLCDLYYKYDTHWNLIGARVATDAMLRSFGWVSSNKGFLIQEKGLAYHYGAEDDLAHMAGVNSYCVEREVFWEGIHVIDWEKYEYEQENGRVSVFRNGDAQSKKSIFLTGDSFRSAMIPTLLEYYSTVYVVKQDYFTTNELYDLNDDSCLFGTSIL